MDGAVYEVIRNNSGTMISAIGVVVAIGLLIATGVRNVESIFVESIFFESAHPAFWFVFRVNAVVIGWLLWGIIASIFGIWVFKGQGKRSQLFRAIGFASAPGALVAFREIDVELMNQTVGEAAVLFALLWTLVTGTQAIKETLRLSWVQAAIPGFIGWGVAWLLTINVILASPTDTVPVPSPTDTDTATSTAQGL